MWTDVNIDLRSCTLRHCCKQQGSKIDMEEIDKLGVEVFEQYEVNVNNKKQMLFANEIPDSCVICQDNNDNAIRHNWNYWSDEFINNNRQQLYIEDMTSYIEIDIGSQCDLACVYCGPWSSTTWANELGIKIEKETKKESEWRSSIRTHIYAKIKQIRKDKVITINFLGGEPTLMKDTYIILDELLPLFKEFTAKPRVIFTSNLNTKPALFKRLLDTVKSTSDYVNWTIGVSIEGIGARAELVRYGLNWERFENNLKEISPYVSVMFTVTHNVLSMPYFIDMLDWMTTVTNTAYRKHGESGYIMPDSDDHVVWDISNNCVYDNAYDPAYLYPDMVDFDSIIAKMTALNFNQPALDHIESMRDRIGTKSPGLDFLNTFNVILKRIDDYKTLFPHIDRLLDSVKIK
jgi:hypothetical protein